MKKFLNTFNVNEKGKIVKIFGSNQVKKRLFDLGFTKGCVIQLIKLAPFGDPMELNLRNYELAIRKNEAKNILMEIL